MSDTTQNPNSPSAEAETSAPATISDNVNERNQHLVNQNAEAALPENRPLHQEKTFTQEHGIASEPKAGGRDPEIPVNYENNHLLIGTSNEDIDGDAPTPMRNLNPEREQEELTGKAPNIAELNALPGAPAVLRGTPAPEIDPFKKFADSAHEPRKSEIESGRGVGVITGDEAAQSEANAKAGAAENKAEFERERQEGIVARLDEAKERAAELTGESETSEQKSKADADKLRSTGDQNATTTGVLTADDPAQADGPKKGKLPEGFPGLGPLEAEGITSYGKLRTFIKSHELTEIAHIGPSTADAIKEALGEPVDGEDDDEDE